MTTKEQLKQVLEKWRFPVLKEAENSLVFRYQMSYVQATITIGGDFNAVALVVSGVFTADDEKEMILGLRTCNDINSSLLQTKLYIDSDSDLIIAAEFFHKTSNDLEYMLKMALRVLIVAKKRFIQRYTEVEEEANLISELEQE